MKPAPDIPPRLPSYPEPWWVRCRWPLAGVLIGLIAFGAFWLLLRAVRQTSDHAARRVEQGFRSAAAAAEAIAGKFKQGTITTTFLAALPEIAGTGSGNLELATTTATETLRREDQLRVFGDRLSLGTTTSEIRVPVTYRYHVRLSDPWRIEVSNQTCVVYAPKVRPSLPPAIHTDKMEKWSENGWARFNKYDQLESLEKSLTPTLQRYAADPKHLAWVREQCRRTVAEFVRTWLLTEDHWRHDRFHAIQVVFADEPPAAHELRGPTLRLD